MEVNSIDECYNIKSIYGYVEVVWRIDNFLLATREKEWIILSPEFCIEGPCLTKWQLCLKAEYIKGNYTVWTRLGRLPCDSIAEPVQVNWMLCYPYDNGNQYMMQEKTKFEVESSIERKVNNVDVLESKLMNSDHSTFVVKCSMFVYLAENERILARSKDKGLKSLSEDLNILYNVGRGFDTAIKIGLKEVLHVHKAIVCSRNRVLRNFVENHGHTVRLDFPNINKEVVRNVIRYFYTGDLKHILRNPSFDMMKAISYLSVNELKPYFIPDEMELQTKFEILEFTFLWTVGVSNLENRDPIFSPELNFENVKFQIVLYPNIVGGKVEFFSIYLRVKEGLWSQDLRLLFSIINIFNQCRSSKSLLWSPKCGGEIGFEYFFPCDVLNDDTFVFLENIKIFCKLHIATGITTHEVIKKEIKSPIVIEKDKHYDRLSRQLTSLFRSGDYSDFTLGSGVLRFKTHKSIICCRSRVLKNMILEQGDVVSVVLPCSDPNIVLKTLYYLYSGKVSECSTSEILNMYSNAETWAILPLKYKCSLILEEKMKVANVCKILFIAHRYKDKRLKESTYKFMYGNMKEIETLTCWTQLVEEIPAILDEYSRFKKLYLKIALHEDKAEKLRCYY